MRRILCQAAICAVLLIALQGGAVAESYSVASLNGTCGWQGTYYPTTSGSAANAGPATMLSPLTFDGNGHVTLDYAINSNGTFIAAPAVSGTYTVDSTGHGSFTYLRPSSGNPVVYDFRISPHGYVLRIMLQSNTSEPPSSLVSGGICSFDE